jgi:radical SAM superfamily enzyme YgiQ (UPF0313 family)
MSNLGFLSVFREAAEAQGILIERAFLPDPEHQISLDGAGKSVLSLESARPLREFSLLLFSISFENDFLNVLRILDIAKIPLRSANRNTRYPLIGAGGVAVQINPETLSPFIDFFALGEGEALAPEILGFFAERSHGGQDREEILDALSDIAGVYVPSHFVESYDDRGRLASFRNVKGKPDRVIVQKSTDLSGMSLCSPIVSADTEFADMLLVELERGCPFACAFCVASSIYSPVRMRPADDIISDMERGMDLADTVGLIGPAVSSHPDLVRILERIREKEGAVGLPSIRTELLTDEGIALLSDLKVRTLTIAPEAGTERLRRVLGKMMTDGDIFSLIGRAAYAGIVNLRLYFLVGIPGETDEDVAAIADFSKRARHAVIAATKGGAAAGRVTVSLTPLVPKPHTPLMWMGMKDRKGLSGKIKTVQSELRKAGGITVVFEPPKWSFIQALLARGDRRVADILEHAALHNEDWGAAMRETPINPDFYVLRERDRDELFPWDFIDLSLDKDKLYARYQGIMAASTHK